MCRTFATPPRRIRWGTRACLIAAIACLLGAEPAAKGRTLFLLAGSPSLNDTDGAFPATLYTVSAQHKLKLFRTVVSGSEGTTRILDDMRGEIYVTFPSDLGVGPVPTKVGIIHKQRPGEDDVVTFNPEVMRDEPYSEATAAGPDLNGYALFVLFPQPPPTVNGHAAFMRYIGSSATTLVAIAGNQPAKAPRVTRNDWSLYNHLTFYGSPGGPGYYFTPQATIESGELVMRLGGRTVFIDRAPSIPAAQRLFRTMWILAANREFLVSMQLGNGRENLSAPAPATLYVHNRLDGTWRDLRSVGSEPECRIFGSWLATRVRAAGHLTGPIAEDENPGHMNESDHGVRYLLPDVRDEFYVLDSRFYIPGIFTLDNLVDRRRITLETHEEDSEILDVRKDGLVLYRVNDEIFSAQIEGDTLSAPTLVVKDTDVPEVHWAFWSKGAVNAPLAHQPSTGR